MLIDTGHFGTRKQILDSLSRFNVKPSEIDNVILSHAHWDHSLNLELFPKATVIINAKELDFIRNRSDFEIPSMLAMLLEKMQLQTTEGDEDLTDDIRIIETPGHTIGHQAILIKTDRETALFTQDAMPTLRSYLRGVPDYIKTTEKEARKSIKKLQQLNPNIYYSGHDRSFRIVDGIPEYTEHSALEIIVRRETEENLRIALKTEKAEKPSGL